MVADESVCAPTTVAAKGIDDDDDNEDDYDDDYTDDDDDESQRYGADVRLRVGPTKEHTESMIVHFVYLRDQKLV